MFEWTDGIVNGCMDEGMVGRNYAWMDGWIVGWMDGWDMWMDEWKWWI